MTGEITVPGERHVFAFAAAPGDLVYLDGRGACGANVAYEVLSPSGTALTGNPYACDDAGRVSLVETGEHTVVVESWSGGAGAYDIALLPIPPDVSTAVSVGDTFAGELTAAGEHDLFTFNAVAGDVVFLDGRTACGAQVAYGLLSPSGTQLGGLPYVCDDLGPVTLVETGAHTISVESYAGGRGAYEIRLQPG
jgi:hypothetical protein